MLKLHVVNEYWNEVDSTFVYEDKGELTLEHSLISISKWESKYCKPFLSGIEMDREETLYYVKCMCIGNAKDDIVDSLSNEDLATISAYIDAPMTATKIMDDRTEGESRRRDSVTSEFIYCQMIAYGIPVEFQKWHLNRLMALISVCAEHNKPKKKMRRDEILARNRDLNAQRRAKYKTKG